MDIGFAGYTLAFLANLVLLLLLLISWRGRAGLRLVIASFLAVCWAGAVSAMEYGLPLPFKIVQLLEFARNVGWILILLAPVAGAGQDGPTRSGLFNSFYGVMLLSLAAVFLFAVLVTPAGVDIALVQQILLGAWVAAAILGMTLVEQLFRNAGEGQRWAVKYLCLGLGIIFAYDFFMYADALLFKQISLRLWEARGFVNVMAIPMIAIAVARNPNYEIDIHVSRKAVFHTAAIVGAGVYLLVMAAVGYLIRFYGSTWGSVMQVVFFVGAGTLLLSILFSDGIRAKVKVFLSKHFFSYRYDYREEWLKFTDHLSEDGEGVNESLIRSMAALTESPGGMLWERLPDGGCRLLARWHMPAPEGVDEASLGSLLDYIQRTQWVVDIDEFSSSPEMYEQLDLPAWLLKMPDVWLIVPLIFRAECRGFVALKHSRRQETLNWEDIDLLKMAGKQAALHLAQFQSDRELAKSRQFEAFNKLSAYVVHDLKNILAQQSLIVSNAEKHKHNPQFVDDVIATVENSVTRMTNLMKQMRSGERGGKVELVELGELLELVVKRQQAKRPCPEWQPASGEFVVRVDREQLATVFGHIIQNAQEATGKEGSVQVALQQIDDKISISVSDDGCGMDEEFIRDRLFKPFDSTKGLTGMGVGAYESREYIRSLGGDITVNSKVNQGTVFRVILPYNRTVE